MRKNSVKTSLSYGTSLLLVLNRFSGPTLIEAVESFEALIRSIKKPLRMLIAETFKSRTLGQAVASGKLEAGAVRIGSKVN
jgi:translation elongation factor EF-1alpha